ncbi:hypothetical protein [Aeromicrobium sp. 9AM]|uniref:hypothetical protein n=1 Tax=Aeromicrobium sp. 9AM TaxID=2653126 RepID=UPI0012F13E99|nr:hypothetical protein [Aeromicrobium sp. 9AM]VXB81971.1 conserved hypothetical protein [Aeromicrobium sp. 9AM]
MSMSFGDTLRLPDLPEASREGQLKGLFYATEHVAQVAAAHAPIEDHTLEQSVVASQNADSMVGAVSFDTPYAARQHEELDWQHDDGRTAKYLENALNSERATSLALIGREVRKALEG